MTDGPAPWQVSPRPKTKSGRPLRVGLFLQATSGLYREEKVGWREMLALVQQAEAVGFDSFWLPDHLLFKHPGQEPYGLWDCWSMFCALAAVTERIELGPLVTCISFRNPALMAKIADTADEISGGRIVLGLGAGWHEPEYHAHGFPFDHRFERFAEAATIIRGLLRSGAVDFQGTHHSAAACELRPRGPRPLGPPIMIGALANRPRMLRMVAEYADIWNGWLQTGRSRADAVAPMRDAVDAACVAVGRDPATLARSVGIAVDQRPAARRTPMGAPDAEPLIGSPEAIAEELRAMAAEGISEVQVTLFESGERGVEAFAPVLAALDNHLDE